MHYGFSFTGNEYESILLNAARVLPGIQKIICVHYESEIDNIRAISIDDPDHNSRIEELHLIDRRNNILKERTMKARFDWLSREDVPFSLEKMSAQQASIFKEHENIVLLLRFKNPDDHLSDLIYIYLKKNFGNFGLGNASRVLSTDNKQIIGSVLFNALENDLHLKRKNREVLKKLNTVNRSLVGEIDQLKTDLEINRNSFAESLVNLSRHILREISAETGKKFSFSEDALSKIKTFNGNIKSLDSIIRESTEYAYNLFFDEPNDEILIKAQYISLHDADYQHITSRGDTDSIDKYEKTINLLDKLDEAAKKVLSRNIKLTSANVGNHCPHPISAPAISDALKKHSKKIIHLMEKYPGKWDLLKNEFRPVQNLIVSEKQKQKTA